ncbi:MAG: GTP 3',8-cyclase MoaA [Eggerthellales bacterium]|nr:GTP 3',8-cyclase MoaA [Eggerthellales bacterium]
MKDSFGRNIDYLRISLTDRCNLRCVYCMPEEGVPSVGHDNILRMEEYARIVAVAAKMGIRHVRLTGGEPLVRKGCVDLARTIAQTPGIQTVALTTNGVLLPAMAQDLKNAGVTRINLSLDTLDAEQYHQITRRGHLQDALAGLQAALSTGFETVKVNVVAIRSLHQDWVSFARLTIDQPLHVRFIEYMPVGNGLTVAGWGSDDVIPTAQLITTISDACQEAGLGALQPADDHRPPGDGPAKYWQLPGAQGTIGFISSVSDHFCASCNRLRLTADGRIKPCLFSDTEYDVRTAVRSGDEQAVEDVLAQALSGKPKNHAHRVGTARLMNQVGG